MGYTNVHNAASGLRPGLAHSVRQGLKSVVKVKGGLLGGIFISLMVLCALFAPWLAPY